MKRWLFVAAGLIAVVLAVPVVWLATVIAGMPANQGARVVLNDQIVGVETGASYAWIVRTKSGAALIDTGMDGEASAIVAELRSQGLKVEDVHTVLLTHAHADHTGGLARFPHARLVHGPGEGPLLRRETVPQGALPWVFAGLSAAPVLPGTVVESEDGAVLDVDGESVRVLSTPGHTLGSASFLWGDVLFSGDTLVGNGTGVQLLPAAVADDLAQNRQSVRKLGALDFDRMADGHVGATADAHSKLEALLAE